MWRNLSPKQRRGVVIQREGACASRAPELQPRPSRPSTILAYLLQTRVRGDLYARAATPSRAGRAGGKPVVCAGRQ